MNSTTLFLACQPFSYYAIPYENISKDKGLRPFYSSNSYLFIFINKVIFKYENFVFFIEKNIFYQVVPLITNFVVSSGASGSDLCSICEIITSATYRPISLIGCLTVVKPGYITSAVG